MIETDNTGRKRKMGNVPIRKTTGKPAGWHDMPPGEMLEFYKSARPDSIVMKLMEERCLGVWRSDIGCHVLFMRFHQVKDVEAVLDEIAAEPPGTHHIDQEGRRLNGMAFRAADSEGSTYYAIALMDSFGFRRSISILAHEAIHTAINILNDHKMTLDAEAGESHNSEPLAYLAGAIIDFGMQAFWEDGDDNVELCDPITELIRKETKEGAKLA